LAKHASAPTVHAADHRYTSWYTHGSDAMYSNTVPPVIVAISKPVATASVRVTAASPRTRYRARHTSSTVAPASTIHAANIDGAVSRPSKRSVRSSTGMRKMAGNGGKYMNVRPSTMKLSMPRIRSGTARWPWNSARAWMS